jgi:hypothetical protein
MGQARWTHDKGQNDIGKELNGEEIKYIPNYVHGRLCKAQLIDPS